MSTTQLHDAVKKWMVDPQELVDDSAIKFPDFVSFGDAVHKALYAVVQRYRI